MVRFYAGAAYSARGHAERNPVPMYPFGPMQEPWLVFSSSPHAINVQWAERRLEQDRSNDERAQSFSVIMRVLNDAPTMKRAQPEKRAPVSVGGCGGGTANAQSPTGRKVAQNLTFPAI